MQNYSLTEMQVILQSLGLHNTFCFAPYTTTDLDQDGSVLTCYRGATKLGNWKTDNFDDIFNNDKIQKIRQDLFVGNTSSNCRSCYHAELKNTSSPRLQIFNDLINDKLRTTSKYNLNLETLVNRIKSAPTVGDVNELKRIELRPSNLCNLRCMHCGPHSSTKWVETVSKQDIYKEFKDLGGCIDVTEEDEFNLSDKFDIVKHYKKLNFINSDRKDSIIELLSKSDHVVFTGGEPLLTPEHDQALDFFIKTGVAPNLSLEYCTNLNIKDLDKTLSKWKQFKRIHIRVSADSDFSTYEYFRTFGNVEQLKSNIQKLKHYQQTSQNELTFMYSITFNLFSALRWKNILENCKEYDMLFHTSMIIDHPTSVQALPSTLQQKVLEEMQWCIEHADKYYTTKEYVHWYKYFTQQAFNFTKNSINNNSMFDNETKNYIQLCDKTSNNNYENYFPELKEYM